MKEKGCSRQETAHREMDGDRKCSEVVQTREVIRCLAGGRTGINANMVPLC